MGLNWKLIAQLHIAYFWLFVSIAAYNVVALVAMINPNAKPFAYAVKTIMFPVFLFWVPLHICYASQLYQNESFPGRKDRLISAVCAILCLLSQMLKDFESLYDWSSLGTGMESKGLCGLGECMGSWLEAGLIVWAVVGECFGWDWDRWWMREWVDAVSGDSIEIESKRVERENRGDEERNKEMELKRMEEWEAGENRIEKATDE